MPNMKRRTNPVAKTSHPAVLTPRNLEALVESRTRSAVAKALSEGGMVQQIVQRTIVQSHSGPLPPAEETARFEALLPGFTDRFITMAEIAQKADIATVERRDRGTLWYKFAALAVLATLGLIMISGGIWMISTDKPIQGFVAIGTATAAVIWAMRRNPKDDSKSS